MNIYALRSISRLPLVFGFLVLCATFAACSGGGEPATDTEEAPAAIAEPAAPPASPYDAAILEVAGRPDDDLYRDEGFKPLDVYGFFGIEPGMTVGDLATSRMYNAHILAQIVGPSGKVIATSTYSAEAREGAMERLQETLDTRNVDGVLDNVEIVATLEDIPENSLDVLVTVRNYHDFGERQGRIDTLPRLMRVLKPGGILGVIDAHTDKMDERDESVHRMNENMAREEIESAGFIFLGSSDVLYNADDTFDFDGRRAGDPIHRYFIQRWTLKFQKPTG
jgi:predicted methyltransferase